MVMQEVLEESTRGLRMVDKEFEELWREIMNTIRANDKAYGKLMEKPSIIYTIDVRQIKREIALFNRCILRANRFRMEEIRRWTMKYWLERM